MKTLFRILIILAAATIIGGLMYVGVSASGSADAPSYEEGSRSQFNSDGDHDGDGFRPEGGEFRPEGERDGERGERGGFGFPGGIIKALVLMTIAGGIYSAIVGVKKKAKQPATG